MNSKSITHNEVGDLNMMARRGFAILILSITVVLAMVGCSGSDVNQGADGKGSLTYKTDEGKDITISSESKRPDDFPDDIPLPEGIVVTASTSSKESGNITVVIETQRPFDEVVKLYQDYADKAGYKETIKMEEESNYMFSGVRDNETFVFNLGLDQEDNKTVTGALTYQKKP